MNRSLTDVALDFAGSQVGVREVGRNAGQKVEEYQGVVGLHPGDPWCAAFVSWCYLRAAEELGMGCPLVVSGGALRLWGTAPPEQRSKDPEPGAIFVIDHGGGLGHVGLVEHVGIGELVTVEGNTNDGGSREGDGVYRRLRPLSAINVGYIVPARSLGAVPQSET